MTSFEVGEESRKPDASRCREESGAISLGREQIEQCREKEASGFFLGRRAKKLSVEGKNFMFPFQWSAPQECLKDASILFKSLPYQSTFETQLPDRKQHMI